MTFASLEEGSLVVLVLHGTDVHLTRTSNQAVGLFPAVIAPSVEVCDILACTDNVEWDDHVYPVLAESPLHAIIVGGNEHGTDIPVLVPQLLHLFPVCPLQRIHLHVAIAVKPAVTRAVDVHSGGGEHLHEVNLLRVSESAKSAQRCIPHHLHVLKKESRRVFAE